MLFHASRAINCLAACHAEEPTIEQLTELTERWTWSGCSAPTEYYKIEDFGHVWPGSFGESRSGIVASEIMWNFFGLSENSGRLANANSNATATAWTPALL